MKQELVPFLYEAGAGSTPLWTRSQCPPFSVDQESVAVLLGDQMNGSWIGQVGQLGVICSWQDYLEGISMLSVCC